MKKNEVRIGNITDKGRVKYLFSHGIILGDGITFNFDELKPVPLNDEWMLKLGFKKVKNNGYINGYEYIRKIDSVEFNGIGKFNYNKTGEIIVTVDCRGNYICNNLNYVHQVQNLYFALSGTEIKIKKLGFL